MKRQGNPLVLFGTLAGIGLAALAFFFVFQTYHLETVVEGVLYRDGNRGIREFDNAIDRIKPRTVVSLLDDNEMVDPEKAMFQEEVELLADRNIRLIRIPVPLGGYPSEADVQQFLEIVQDPENQPVLVHCAQGVRRTGMMVAAYQETVQKLSDAAVGFRIVRFGRKTTSDTMADVARFIHYYDGETGKIDVALYPTTQPVSQDDAQVANSTD